MAKHSAIIFETTPDGCMVPTNKKLNADGYYRKRWANEIEMFHRFIWRARKGPIPDGYEINHLCGNRACQNVDHLECIPGEDHAIKTNRERYAHINAEAKRIWQDTGCTPTKLAKNYGWKAYGWVRKWKEAV